MFKQVLICSLGLLSYFANLSSQANTIELEHNQVKQLVKNGTILSLDDTLTIIHQYCSGKLIDAHLYQVNNSWRYDLQLKQPNGQIINLSLNAVNGQPVVQSPIPSECQQDEIVTR